MKNFFCAMGLWLLVVAFFARGAEFSVSRSGRNLELEGKPFFWLADTVWLLAQVPTRDEVELYLKTRKEQGFTVIQLTAVMSEERVWGTKRVNVFGDKPFLNDNPATPAVTPGSDSKDPAQYDYWDHFDYVIDRIHAHGMRAAVVTMFVGHQGEGYKFLRKDNAHQYGRFLGERCRSKPQVVWLLGGDNTPGTAERQEVWNLVAKGITEGTCGRDDYTQTTMTYHINGGASSSQFWHTAPWLDFNMAQTWSTYTQIHEVVLRDYNKTPPKPCGLGEGAYEDGPQYPTKPIDDLVIRKQAYWSYFAGGYHTYGNGNVWHFDSLKSESTQPWKQALKSAGAGDLLTLRKFFEGVKWPRFIPDQSLLGPSRGSGKTLNCAMRTPERDAFIFYLTGTNEVSLDQAMLPGSRKLSGFWMNPDTGERREIKELRETTIAAPKGWADALLSLNAR